MSEDLKGYALPVEEQIFVLEEFIKSLKEGNQYTLNYFLTTYLIMVKKIHCMYSLLYLYFPLLNGKQATQECDLSKGNSIVAGREVEAGVSEPAASANSHTLADRCCFPLKTQEIMIDRTLRCEI